MLDLGLKGRAAIITGGSLGIGRAIAEAFAREGMKVALVARTADTLEKVAAKIRAATGAEVLAVPCNVKDTDAVRAAVDATAKAFGRLDVLINGAAHPGGLVRNEIEYADPATLLHDMDVKVMGYFRMAQAVVPHMRANNWGRILNIGGLTGRGSKQFSGMRNVAICHMTKTLSDQVGQWGITANVIHPGVVYTPHVQELYEAEAKKQNLTVEQVETNYKAVTPIRRILTPEDVADAALFLCSTRAGAITGESLGVDGGITRGIFL